MTFGWPLILEKVEEIYLVIYLKKRKKLYLYKMKELISALILRDAKLSLLLESA